MAKTTSDIVTISRNLKFMAANRLISLLVSFIIFPFIVRYTGQEIYGVYLIVITLTGYFGLLDFGVMSALTKYVSEYKGKGDRIKINNVINASFTFYALVGVVACISLFIMSRYLNSFFQMKPQEAAIANNLVTAASLFSLLIWPLSTFRGALEGLNLWNLEAAVNSVIQVTTAILAYIIFSCGYDIVLFFIATQSCVVAGNMVFLFIAKKETDFRLKFPFLDSMTFKRIFRFSIFMFLSSLVNIFLFQIHNLIIGFFLSMSAVTIYSVAHNLQNYFRYINSTLGGPPWTVASEMEGRKDYNGQRLLLMKGTKYLTALFIPAVIIMIFYADPFIRYWMGPGFEESILPARIVITFWLFNGTIELAVGMLSAKGVVKESLYIQIIIAISNILISLLLIKVIGITAIALGITLSMIVIGVPLYLRLSLSTLELKFAEYFQKSIKKNLATYFLATTLSLASMIYFYPRDLFITILEISAIYFLSLSFHYLFVLDKEEKMEIIKISGLKTLKGLMEKT